MADLTDLAHPVAHDEAEHGLGVARSEADEGEGGGEAGGRRCHGWFSIHARFGAVARHPVNRVARYQ